MKLAWRKCDVVYGCGKFWNATKETDVNPLEMNWCLSSFSRTRHAVLEGTMIPMSPTTHLLTTM